MATSHKRILNSLGNGPTRRNLFGPVDREQLQREYQNSLRKDLEEASQRWGFDFFSEKPLEGSDFQWEGISGAMVPLLYRPCMVGTGQVESQRPVEAAVAVIASPSKIRVRPSWCDKENIPRSPERCVVNIKKLEKTPEKRDGSKLKRKQTNITDFYQTKRRVVGTACKSSQ